jgi:peptidoglycan/LPS O-acetylase OafA/YrhL
MPAQVPSPTVANSVAAQPSARFIPSLDGLRAMAVALVMLFHAGVPFLRSGGVGVDVFFTLSGFLITTLLLREFRTYGGISLKNFYMRRFLRLMPALWLTVAFVLAACFLLGVHAAWPLRDAAIALTYTTNWARVYGMVSPVTLHSGWIVDSPLAHTWSLAVEEQYYLLWAPIIVFICRRFSPARTRRNASISASIPTRTGFCSARRWPQHLIVIRGCGPAVGW